MVEECPQRGKGKPKGNGKGSYGRSKGERKGSYGKTKGYYADDDWGTDDWSWCYFFVGLAQIYMLKDQHPSLAVLDTGTTQSAGSLEAIASLIDHLKKVDNTFSFRVTHDNIPLFHLETVGGCGL